MKAYTFALIVLGSLLLIIAGSASLQSQEIGEFQWRNIKPTRPPAAPPAMTDNTPSFYKRKAEWKKIIDEYWGTGATLQEKQRVFNEYADYIQRYFTAFEGLNISWDSLRSHYFSQINDSTSHGRFSAILSYLAYHLREPHTAVLDFSLMSVAVGDTVLRAFPSRGKPVWFKTTMPTASHFGAVLTPLADSSALVIRAIENHPLGLKRGDIVLGYEGVPWRQIARELLAAEVPTLALFGGSRTMEMHHLLGCAGFNWHLFDTIDIVKYPAGDTVHLPVDTLASIRMIDSMYNNESMEIPGVPAPDWNWADETPNARPVTHGIVEGTNVGYIFVGLHTSKDWGDPFPDTEELFSQAIGELKNSDGLIIDLRHDRGGWVQSNFNTGFGRLLNFDTHTLDYWWRASASDLIALTPYNVFSAGRMFINADEETLYDRPIAVLVGPGCVSMGDITAYRLTYFPNTRFFGKPTSMGWAGDNWTGQAPQVPGCILAASDIVLRDHYDAERDLERMEFPVDEEVWLTQEDVAKGEDTVVKRALAWINGVAHARDVAAQKRFLHGGTDTVQLTGTLQNPGGRPLEVKAYYRVDSTIVDSSDLADDGLHGDGAQGDGIWGSSWNVPQGEAFYNVFLSVRDPGDSTTFSMPYLARFTTAGPVMAWDTIETEVPFAATRTINVWLRNAGQTRKIPSVTCTVSTKDTLVRSFLQEEWEFGDITPGDSAKRRYVASVDPAIGTLLCTLDIGSGGFHYWKKEGVIVTGVEDQVAAIPTTYALRQNYPNPFNPSTLVRYQLPVASEVRLMVYDLLGREVAVLVNEKKAQGTYMVTFDASGLTTGVYIYRLTAGSFTQTNKMLLIK